MSTRRHFLGAMGATLLAARLSHAAADADVGATPTPQLLRVALVCDTHINLATEGEPALYRPHFDAVIAEVNSAKVDAVLLGGDLTEGGTPETIAAFLAQSAKLEAPQLRVAGNHDVGAKITEGAKSNLSDERVTRFEALMGPSLWSREIGGARFIGVNASLFGSGLQHEIAQWEFLGKRVGETKRCAVWNASVDALPAVFKIARRAIGLLEHRTGAACALVGVTETGEGARRVFRPHSPATVQPTGRIDAHHRATSFVRVAARQTERRLDANLHRAGRSNQFRGAFD